MSAKVTPGHYGYLWGDPLYTYRCECGKQVERDHKFCPGCGTALDWALVHEKDEADATRAAKRRLEEAKAIVAAANGVEN